MLATHPPVKFTQEDFISFSDEEEEVDEIEELDRLAIEEEKKHESKRKDKKSGREKGKEKDRGRNRNRSRSRSRYKLNQLKSTNTQKPSSKTEFHRARVDQGPDNRKVIFIAPFYFDTPAGDHYIEQLKNVVEGMDNCTFHEISMQKIKDYEMERVKRVFKEKMEGKPRRRSSGSSAEFERKRNHSSRDRRRRVMREVSQERRKGGSRRSRDKNGRDRSRRDRNSKRDRDSRRSRDRDGSPEKPRDRSPRRDLRSRRSRDRDKEKGSEKRRSRSREGRSDKRGDKSRERSREKAKLRERRNNRGKTKESDANVLFASLIEMEKNKKVMNDDNKMAAPNAEADKIREDQNRLGKMGHDKMEEVEEVKADEK